MSLVVRRTTVDPFEDRPDRKAMARYCTYNNYEYIFGGRYAPVDMVAKMPNGITVALEVQCNAAWTTQLTYPESYIHIPKRKWVTFRKQVKNIPDKNIVKAEKAYFALLNKAHTRVAFISFESLFNDLKLFKEERLNIYNKLDLFVWVPVSYILKYRDIPRQDEIE